MASYSLVQFATELSFLFETLCTRASMFWFLPVFYSSEFPSESSNRLSLENSKTSTAHITKLFKTAPTNQFQIFLQHIIRYRCNNNLLLCYQFSVLVNFPICEQDQPTLTTKRGDLFCSQLQWFQSIVGWFHGRNIMVEGNGRW